MLQDNITKRAQGTWLQFTLLFRSSCFPAKHQFAFLIHPFQRANICLHQYYTSNRYMLQLLCTTVSETEHKACLWTAIYNFKNPYNIASATHIL